MANWNGIPKKFNLEISKNGYPYYEDVEFKWDYNTTADILRITRTEVESKIEYFELYSKEYAEAFLYTMASWYITYEGKEKFKKLLKDLLKE